MRGNAAFWIGVAAISCSACATKQEVPDEEKVETLMTLTEEGFDGIDRTQRVNALAISKAYPDLEVDSDGFGRRYAVRRDGNTIALIEPKGEIGYRAKVLANSVVGPRGVRVGQDFSTIARLDDLQCRRGDGEWASQIYCTTSDMQGIVFGFDGSVVDTGSCERACVLAENAALTGHSIEMIDWDL